MCLGEAGTLSNTVGQISTVVSALDCPTTPFVLKRKIPGIKIILSDICYMDCLGFIAACSNIRIYATSNDGCTVWDISPQTVDKNVDPKSLVYLPYQDMLLMDDRKNKQIIVVTGSAGYAPTSRIKRARATLLTGDGIISH